MSDTTNADSAKTSGARRWLWWSVLVAMVFTVWVVASTRTTGERPRMNADIAAGRQILLALRHNSASKPNGTIEELDELVAKGVLEDDSPLYETDPDGTKKARWIFLGYGQNTLGGAPVIISARPHGGKRFVGTTDTSMELWTEDFFQTFALEQGLKGYLDPDARR